MSSLSRQQLEKSLASGNVDPLYLLHGAETFLRDEAARAIADVAMRGTLIREFNESRLSVATLGAAAVIAVAEQLPMMSERRVVCLTDFGKLREAEEEIVTRYLENPAPSSVVIFLASDLDKRKKLTKQLQDRCTEVEFPPVSDAEARAWAQTYLRQQKTTATAKVIEEIVRLVGTDIRTLRSELDKLSTAAADTAQITPDLVADLIGRSRELSNFELTDHLIRKNRQRALEVLHRLLEDGAEPVMLIGLIASNYHRLALARDLFQRGGKQEVLRAIRLPWSKRNEFLATVQSSTAEHIAHGIARIAAADLAIKTSQATPRLQLEMLVCELAA